MRLPGTQHGHLQLSLQLLQAQPAEGRHTRAHSPDGWYPGTRSTWCLQHQVLHRCRRPQAVQGSEHTGLLQLYLGVALVPHVQGHLGVGHVLQGGRGLDEAVWQLGQEANGPCR